MNVSYRYLIYALSIALASSPSVLANTERLTPEQVVDLTAPSKVVSNKCIWIEISGYGRYKYTLNQTMVIENGREFRFPTEFMPPAVVTAPDRSAVVTPTTPTAFDVVNAGWTIRLQAKLQGSVVAVSGIADFVDVKLVNGGYGALAGPIYNKQGEVITTNVLRQPLQQTTTSRFHLSAVPGETYEILLYKGKKAEKHTIKVSLE